MSPYRARWYVYELIDPRSDTVFYVGKGQKNRVDQHEEEARKGVISHKCNKIRSIWGDGCQINKRKIALFWDETAAYKCEADRIDEIGLCNLTNVMPGSIPLLDWVERRNKAKDRKENTSKPLTVELCMKVIRDYIGYVAVWLRRPTPTSKLVVTHKEAGPLQTFDKFMLENLFNLAIPIAWGKVINEPSTHEELTKLLQQWNIQLIIKPC